MLKERRLAANAVAEKLFAVEVAIDAAVAAAAELTAVMPQARQSAHLAASVGQDALASAMATCMKLIQARAAIISTHEFLATTQKDIGLAAVNFGNVGGDKPSVFGIPVGRHLSSVAA